MTRQAIFAAVREAAPDGIFSDPGNILALDNLLDAFGVEREDEVRRIGSAGMSLLKHFEGLVLTAYRDIGGVLTIGYGSTGAHVKPSMTITEPEAEKLLRDDLDRFERCVAEEAPDATQNQFDAMVSLAFNIGEAAFRRSTVLRMHKAGNHTRAALAFGMWIYVKGRQVRGLIRRRQAEAQLYQGEA